MPDRDPKLLKQYSDAKMHSSSKLEGEGNSSYSSSMNAEMSDSNGEHKQEEESFFAGIYGGMYGQIPQKG